jgi:excisionase family DNA binding protein
MVSVVQTPIDTISFDRVEPELRPARFTRDDVIAGSEVAELLHLSVSNVYYLARRGELPARRPGRTWRFLRWRLEEHLHG